MPPEGPNSLIKPAVRMLTAGVCSAFAGPLGGLTGAFIGGMLGNLLGAAVGEFGKTTVEKLTEKASEAFLDANGESLIERLKKSKPSLETVYREALRLSLSQIHTGADARFDKWFANWDTCLKASVRLELEEVQLAQLAPDKFDERFRSTMERLDAQGNAIKSKSQSLTLRTRVAPELLLSALKERLPEHFEENFRELIVQREQVEAWNQLELDFRRWLVPTISGIAEYVKPIPKIAEDTAATRGDVAAIRRMLEGRYNTARDEGRIPEQELKAKDAEINRLTEELLQLKQQLAARSAEPAEAELSKLLAAGDLDAAVHLKTQQVEGRSKEAAKLPLDYYELGTIYELRFEWREARDAYRKAWELGNDPEHGFKFAYVDQKLNNLSNARAVYEAILRIYKDPAKRAITLNNLANLYRATQHIKEAEEAFKEALAIGRKLVEDNPHECSLLTPEAVEFHDGKLSIRFKRTDQNVYHDKIAGALNNLANLYRDTQRLKEAEEAYGEALAIERELAKLTPDTYLPLVVTTLLNCGKLYRLAQRMKEAEQAWTEALGLSRQLAKEAPGAYLSYVAAALDMLAALYGDTARIQESHEACVEALAIRRKLAKANHEFQTIEVADTLSVLAVLYFNTGRMKDAEQAYDEELAIRRMVLETNPDLYQPGLASTLNNLAAVYNHTQRYQKAEQTAIEGLAIRRDLAKANPDAYLPRVADSLVTLGIIYKDTQLPQKAGKAYREALAIYRKLATANPDVHLPRVALTLLNIANLDRSLLRADLGIRLPRIAMILYNFATLFRRINRLRKADQADVGALAIYRKLALANPDEYLPRVAATLKSLGIWYNQTQRLKQAKQVYAEALATWQEIATAKPNAHLSDVAAAHSDLAYILQSAGELQQAEMHASDAERVLDPLWRKGRELHGDKMARILWIRALILQSSRKPEEACSFARRALATAYDSTLKLSLQQLIDQLCPSLRI